MAGRDLERLQLQLRAPNSAPTLADGGTLVPDLMMPCRKPIGTPRWPILFWSLVFQDSALCASVANA